MLGGSREGFGRSLSKLPRQSDPARLEDSALRGANHRQAPGEPLLGLLRIRGGYRVEQADALSPSGSRG